MTCSDGQAHGSSQRELVATFTKLLRDAFGIEITDPVINPRVFLYLDDAIFSGDTLRRDLRSWIENDAPAMASVHVVVFTLHTGFWYARKRIGDAIQASGKQITVTYWRAQEVKNKRDERRDAGVLWPWEIPDEEVVENDVGGFSARGDTQAARWRSRPLLFGGRSPATGIGSSRLLVHGFARPIKTPATSSVRSDTAALDLASAR